ncbi:hypothetical protein KVK50_03540 [Helicobacter pylori]|nr:hypothetical protein [Helicobacter pylori]WRB25236.1 hypothetical protein KVK50_03540 [Helicobacter pylori]
MRMISFNTPSMVVVFLYSNKLSVGYKKILHFLRLDSKEFDFIQAVFFKAFFRGDFSCRGE